MQNNRRRESRVLRNVCYPLATPKPMSMVFCLGTRFRVRMRTKLEDGIFHSEQQPQCYECLLLTRVNFRLWRCWVVEKLCTVMSIRFVLQPFSSYCCLNKSRNEERKNTKNGTFTYCPVLIDWLIDTPRRECRYVHINTEDTEKWNYSPFRNFTQVETSK